MPESRLIVVFDEHFSKKLVDLLQISDGPIAKHVASQGWKGQDDDFWMPYAAKAGMVIVTCDRNEKTRRTKISDFQEMGARVFFFGAFWSNLGRWGQTKWLVRYWDKLAAEAVAMTPGTCTVVFSDGKITRYDACTPADLKRLKKG